MDKTRANQTDVYESTIAIDTWIMEHIQFFENEWHQKVQVGSHLLRPHQDFSGLLGEIDKEKPDVVGYTVHPGIKPSHTNGYLFIIDYFADSIRIRSSDEVDIDKSAHLLLASPHFFDHLEAIIWNIRLLDYVAADLDAIAKNIEAIDTEILDNRDDAFNKIGFLKQLHEFTGEIEAKVRHYAGAIVRDKEKIAWPTVDDHKRVQVWKEKEENWEDEIPF